MATEVKKALAKIRTYELAFLKAARDNNVEKMKKFLPTISDINCTLERTGKTALHLAATYNCLSVVRFLMTIAEVDFLKQDIHGATALHWAAHYGHRTLCEELLAKDKAMIDIPDQDGATPLALAVCKGSDNAVIALIENGANTHTRDIVNNTLLHRAVLFNRESIIERLLDTNLDPELRNDDGFTAIELAYRQQHDEIIKIFKIAAIGIRLAQEPIQIDICLIGNDVETAVVKNKSPLSHQQPKKFLTFEENPKRQKAPLSNLIVAHSAKRYSHPRKLEQDRSPSNNRMPINLSHHKKPHR